MIITFLVLLNEYRPRIKQVHENQDNSKHNNNEKIQPDWACPKIVFSRSVSKDFLGAIQFSILLFWFNFCILVLIVKIHPREKLIIFG